MPSYRPLVVRIGQPENGSYPLTAEFQGLQAHAGIPGDVLRQCLADSDAFSQASTDPTRGHLGSRLFDALFTGDVLRLFEMARSWLGPGEQLRIVLGQPLPEPLGALPWELIFDAQGEPKSLSASPNSPLVRHAPANTLPHAPPTAGALRVLAVVALPPGVLPSPAPTTELARALTPRDRLRLLMAQLEPVGLKEAARRLAKGRRYTVALLEGATRENLQDALAAAARAGAPYHVVHFFGEAAGDGALLLPDGSGGLEAIAPADFAQLVVGDALTVLVVTLCQAGPATEALRCVAEEATRRGAPAVVAMHVPELDASVVDFSREFYRALATGEPIELALAYARRLARQLHGAKRGVDLPAVYMAHTGGLSLPSMERIHIVPRAWRLFSWALATAFAIVGTTSGILDLPSFPQMLRERAPVIRCLWPNSMDSNRLTIAFLPLTTVTEDGRATHGASGHAVGDFLYQRFRLAFADLKLDVPYEIRPPALACQLPGGTAEGRAQAARNYARRIGADILIYGVITDTLKSDRMALAFNVDYKGYDTADEISGPFALGGSLPVSLPFEAQELLVIEHPPQLVRMNVLAELVVGLSYLRADNPDKALAYFESAAGDPHWPNVDGKEFAYLLTGHALTRRVSLTGELDGTEDALAAYDAALTIKPDYLRAQLGRASALAILAFGERGPDGSRILNRSKLAEAEAAYRKVLAESASLSALESGAAHAGLGYVYMNSVLHGEPADYDRAATELNQVTRAYEAGKSELARIAGQAYGYLAVLTLLQGDRSGAMEQYKKALDLVAPVSRAFYLSRLSQLTCEQGDVDGALEFAARAVDEARQYGRASEVDDYARGLKALQGKACQ